MRRRLPVLFSSAALLLGALGTFGLAPAVADSNPGKDACKTGGYTAYVDPSSGAPFANQGQCVAFVNHGGTLMPVAPPG